MRTVVIINGFKRSGKDTVVENARSHALNRGVPVTAMSSIDPVFNLLRTAGIRLVRNALSDVDRTALAEVGNALEKAYAFKTRDCVARVMDAFHPGSQRSQLVFIHMREPEQIRQLIYQIVEAMGQCRGKNFEYRVETLLVRRPSDDQNLPDNVSDRGVLNFEYDRMLYNSGTLGDLDAMCGRLTDDLLAEPRGAARVEYR